MIEKNNNVIQSPGYLRMSLAAAMTLNLKQGLFYRGAKLYCVNLLLTYPEGCAAKCAYCGLSAKRPGGYGQKSFIRVTWPAFPLEEIIERISTRQSRVKRICISMITNKRAVQDTMDICAELRTSFDIPVSLLISPTILGHEDLIKFKAAGADKIGVAIDLATPELFDQFRGKGAGGPHLWERYWACLEESIEIFGNGNAGSHFMVGMGESEKEMVGAIQRVRGMGGRTHLFSFFPEGNCETADRPMPPMDQYRRVQLARYLIDNRIGRPDSFVYDDEGRVIDFGLSHGELRDIVDTGEPFRTSGCEGYDGTVACNRPYANSRPGPDIRNYPFPPEKKDVLRVAGQMGLKGPLLNPYRKHTA